MADQQDDQTPSPIDRVRDAIDRIGEQAAEWLEGLLTPAPVPVPIPVRRDPRRDPRRR